MFIKKPIFILILHIPFCFGTEIILTNGNTFTGEIISESANFIILHTGGSNINIAKSLIKTIDGIVPSQEPQSEQKSSDNTAQPQPQSITLSSGRTINVKLKNGTSFHGKILSQNTNVIVLDVGGSRVNIFKTMIDEIDGKKLTTKKLEPQPEKYFQEKEPLPAPVKSQPKRPIKQPETVTKTPPTKTVKSAIPTVVSKSLANAQAKKSQLEIEAASPPLKPITQVTADKPPSPPIEEPVAGQPDLPHQNIDNKPVRNPVTQLQQPTATAPPLPESRSVSSQPVIEQKPKPEPKKKKSGVSVQKHIDKLRSPLIQNRINAAIALSRIGPEASPAVPILIISLRDTVLYKPSQEHKDPSQLIEQPTTLSDEAVKAVINIGEPSVRQLIAALKHQNEIIRSQAAYALGEIGDPKATKNLIEALKDTNLFVRDRTMDALIKIGAIKPLLSVLKERNSDIKKYVIEVLGGIKTQDAVEPLIKQLKNRDSYIREKAAYALGEIGDKRAVDPLIDLLSDNISFVRHNAIEALEKIGDTRAIPPIRVTLKDQSTYVREKAAHALKKLSQDRFNLDNEGLDSLISALKNKNPDIRQNAVNSLIQKTGKDFGADYEKWKKWWDNNRDSFIPPKESGT